jgi:2'-5' RNA ligase
MSKERLKSPRARLFVALDLPDDARAGLVQWQARELGDPALRPLAPEAIHMTLVFLGYHCERDVERIAETALAAGGEAPAVRLLPDPLPVPPRGQPRLFALEAESPEAIELQADVSARLAEAGLYEPEKRRFWPHLTIARVRAAKRGAKRRMDVGRRPGPLPEALLEPFKAVRLTLYRSNLRQQGAEYVPLAQKELELPGEASRSGRRRKER